MNMGGIYVVKNTFLKSWTRSTTLQMNMGSVVVQNACYKVISSEILEFGKQIIGISWIEQTRIKNILLTKNATFPN